MQPFLNGFFDELIKLSGPNQFASAVPTLQTNRTASGIVRPPSTGSAGPAPVPKPPNAFGPSGEMLGAIPTQKMESPASTAPQTWRPSPGYRPNPMSDPAPAAPQAAKPRGGAKPATSTATPAWETSQQMHQRENTEAAYNQGRTASGPPVPGSNARPTAMNQSGYQKMNTWKK